MILKAGVRPDPVEGGYWRIRLVKGVVARIFEDLTIWIISDQPVTNIVGLAVSCGDEDDEISIWTRNADAGPENLKVRNGIRTVLGDVMMDYVPH